MALINCSECGKEISDKSKACIHCGNPIEVKKVNIEERMSEEKPTIIIKSNEAKRSLMKIIFSVLLVLTIIISFVLFNNYQNAEKKKQAEVLYKIYNNLSDAYVYSDKGFTNYVLLLSNEKLWETSLTDAFMNAYSNNKVDNSNIVAARELLAKVEIDFNTSTEKARVFLPKQYNELLQMWGYINDYFDYSAMTNPETDTHFQTGPEWIDFLSKINTSLTQYAELENNFLLEINRLR